MKTTNHLANYNARVIAELDAMKKSKEISKARYAKALAAIAQAPSEFAETTGMTALQAALMAVRS